MPDHKPRRLNVTTDSQPSHSSRLVSFMAWLADPRITAILAALTLRLAGKLSEEWTALALLTAIGGRATQGLIDLVSKLRKGK